MPATTASLVYSTQIVHIGSGTSLAPGAINPASDVSVALAGSGNLGRYPLADIQLMIAPTASIALASTGIVLYRRDLNFDSTNEADQPGTSNSNRVVGLFSASATTTASTTHYLQITDVSISGGDCEFYIGNGLGVNIPVGWTLKVIPKSEAFA